MSQTKQWTVNLGTTVRDSRSSSSQQGAGDSTRIYVGYYNGFDYDSYLRFALDWTGVGRIVSAILTIYTDDGLGIMDSTTTGTPRVIVRRLKDSFTEGSGSPTFTSADFTSAAGTTSGQKSAYLARDVFGVNNIDITAIAEAWAPKTVKKRDGSPGSAITNFGIGLFGYADAAHNWAGFSEDYTDATYRPVITLTYELGTTTPDVPTNLAPAGVVSGLSDFQGDFTDSRSTDQLRFSEVEVYTAAATNAGQVVTGGTRIYAKKRAASATEIGNDRFAHVPDDLYVVPGTTYKWRCRVYDQEGKVSLWTNLVSFSTQDTAPNAPTNLSPAGTSYATLDGVQFTGTFSDDDVGNYMLAHQVQLSAYPESDTHWDDDEFILWNTGKVYATTGAEATSFASVYGGSELAAGTYYWRARTWDNKQAVGAWEYSSVILTDDFEPDPDVGQTAIQLRPRAPWRIVVKDMGANRGPGSVVAIIEDAKNVGASLLYNSPGELHFTLPKDHPQISVLEPKQTHYSVQFRQGDGWREVFAGLMWDFDASDVDVVFYGIDYLALLDYIVDERYDPSNPDKPVAQGGSKYVSTGQNSIGFIVNNQLTVARGLTNSPVAFITVGAIATMTETLTVYSTYAPVLTFITGLLDSHRAGTGKKTRIVVRQKTGGGYEFAVLDDPGQVRDNLRLRYGELVQGYRVIPFGTDWASRISAIGRSKDGIKVLYKTATTPGIDEATWGRFNQVRIFDGVSDGNDMMRRTKQAAVAAGKLGKSIGLGLRSGILQPRDGFDICDIFPVDIVDGSVNTGAFGSGYWVAMGITWTADARTGKQETTLTLLPREDSAEPDEDLLTLEPISPQAIWQVGWKPPVTIDGSRTAATLRLSLDAGHLMDDDHTLDEAYHLIGTGNIYLDQKTGYVYELLDDGTWSFIGGAGTMWRPTAVLASARPVINPDGTAVVNLSVKVTQ